MFIFLLIVGGLSVGLIAGSATARVGYAFDTSVRDATRDLEAAKKLWEEKKTAFEAVKRADDGYYNAQRDFSAAVESLSTYRHRASRTFYERRKGWMIAGGAMIPLWPLGVAVGAVAGLGFVVYKLASKAIVYALTPAQFDEHSELLKGTMSS